MNITIFGIGKLGAPMAALFAEAGHHVFCIDRSEATLEAIRQRRAPVEEPGLQELFDLAGDRLTAVPPERAQEAVESSRFVFLIVPTPSLDSGAFSNQYIQDCLPPIAAALQDGHHPHVVVTCTTSPGSCQMIAEELQRQSGRCAGLDFQFSYSPHFIALGSVLQNMRRPDFILVGSNVPAGAQELFEFYDDLHMRLGDPVPEIACMNLVNAELTKLGLNCATTQKISFANQMALLCERIPGADAATVCRAIGLDSRIGRKYMKPATIYSGPCFPRDNRAFRTAAASQGVEAPLAQATDEINQQMVSHVVNWIDHQNPQRLAILGLAYKPDTAVTDESLATRLIPLYAGHLTQNIRLHDPRAVMSRENCRQYQEARETVQGADMVVIATDWPEYHRLDPDWFKQSCLILDLWDVLDPVAFRHHDRYVPGRGEPCLT
jgi:UDPglucose 6-dehydrogenase